MKIFFTAILSFLLLMTTVEAAKVDAYRNIISSERFTIKYTIIEPPVHVTNSAVTLDQDINRSAPYDFNQNKNIFSIMLGKFEMIKKNPTDSNADDFKGVVVCDGANRYFEDTSVPDYLTPAEATKLCVLKKNDERFRFRYWQDKGKIKYWGNYGAKGVYANLEEGAGIMNAVDVMKEDYSYGILTTALAPMISTDKVIATHYTPEYKFVGSGTLNGGLSYEDFFGSKNGFNCAIRYYFDGDTLSKIAVFDYIMKDSRVQSYEKYLVQIDEFSSTPDQSYLTLPEGLKDKTRRDKGAKK